MTVAIDNARAAYPILARLAKTLSKAVKDHKPVIWLTHDDLVRILREKDLKETHRTLNAKLLPKIQAECLKIGLPDLSAIVIKKPKGDLGNLIGPSDTWWAAYSPTVKGIDFWFAKYREARDHDWPDVPFW